MKLPHTEPRTLPSKLSESPSPYCVPTSPPDFETLLVPPSFNIRRTIQRRESLSNPPVLKFGIEDFPNAVIVLGQFKNHLLERSQRIAKSSTRRQSISGILLNPRGRESSASASAQGPRPGRIIDVPSDEVRDEICCSER